MGAVWDALAFVFITHNAGALQVCPCPWPDRQRLTEEPSYDRFLDG